jgi:hypothetical protein
MVVVTYGSATEFSCFLEREFDAYIWKSHSNFRIQMYRNILSRTIYFAEANSYDVHANIHANFGLRLETEIHDHKGQFQVMFA